MLFHTPHNIPLNGDHNPLPHEKKGHHRSKFTFSPQHTICLNIFQTPFSASIPLSPYIYQIIIQGRTPDPYNTFTHSMSENPSLHERRYIGTQSEPEPLLLELLLLLPDLLLAAGLPDFDLVPDLDLLLLEADPLRDLLLLLEADRDLDFERDFLTAASGLRVGDLLTDLDLLRLADRDLLRLTERDLLLLTLRDLLLLTDLDLSAVLAVCPSSSSSSSSSSDISS